MHNNFTVGQRGRFNMHNNFTVGQRVIINSNAPGEYVSRKGRVSKLSDSPGIIRVTLDDSERKDTIFYKEEVDQLPLTFRELIELVTEDQLDNDVEVYFPSKDEFFGAFISTQGDGDALDKGNIYLEAIENGV